MHNNAPILLFNPDPNFVFSARVKLLFRTKWDAGALMVWADDHRWAKLSFVSVDGNYWHILWVFELGSGRVPRVGFEIAIARRGGTEVVFSEIRYIASKIGNIYNEPELPAQNRK